MLGAQLRAGAGLGHDHAITTEDVAAILRQRLADYYETDGAYVHEAWWKDTSVDSWDQHKRKVSENGHCAGFADVDALACLLDVSIHVYDGSGRRRRFGRGCFLGNLLLARGHYVSIIDHAEVFGVSPLRWDELDCAEAPLRVAFME